MKKIEAWHFVSADRNLAHSDLSVEHEHSECGDCSDCIADRVEIREQMIAALRDLAEKPKRKGKDE